MRIWHIELLPYLPELQFKGQLRELVAIMHDIRDKGKTNHILVNKIMEYGDYAGFALYSYIMQYNAVSVARFGKRVSDKIIREFFEFSKIGDSCYEQFAIYAMLGNTFFDWHNKEYLRVNMANLYEKHFFGVGKSRITETEWKTLLEGYKKITGTEYEL